MQTRKNRKNDEASYEKMLKLRRDLYRAITLLELVKRREKHKRENLHLAIDIYEKRYISTVELTTCHLCKHRIPMLQLINILGSWKNNNWIS